MDTNINELQELDITSIKYWNIGNVLTYNRLFNFIITNRGFGKSYSCKKRVVTNFINKGEQFILLRRYKSELKEISTFWDDLIKNNEFPNVKLEVKGHHFFINDKLAGYVFVLSTAKILKSVAFPLVTFIIFEEFMLDKGTHHYLPDEVIQFLEFYETVARLRNNVIVFFLANATTTANPYFMFWDIKPKPKGIVCKGDILIQTDLDKNFVEFKKRTRFGQLTAGTKYADYAIENKFLRDVETFIEPMDKTAHMKFRIIYKQQNFGIWEAQDKSRIWVSKKVDMSSPWCYSFSVSEHTENDRLIKNASEQGQFRRFLMDFKRNYVYFTDMQTKNTILDLIERTYK